MERTITREDIENADYLPSGDTREYLLQVIEEANEVYDAIQSQEEIPENKRDKEENGTKIRISTLETTRKILVALNHLDEIVIRSNSERYYGMRDEVLSLKDEIYEYNKEERQFEKKKSILKDLFSILEKTMIFFEEMEEENDES